MAFRRPITRLEQIPDVAASGAASGETIVKDTITNQWVAGTASPPPAGTVNRTRYGALADRPAADGTQGIWFDTDTTPPTQYLDTGAWEHVWTDRARYGALAARPAADGTQGIWFDTDPTPPTQYVDTGAWEQVGLDTDDVTKRAVIF